MRAVIIHVPAPAGRGERRIKTCTRIYLARHGRLVNSHRNVYNGRTDIELSHEGMAQTAALSGWLRDKPVTAIYSSDLRRSYDGAKIIAVPLGLKVNPLRAFRERDFGQWEGMTADEIQTLYRDEWEKWLEDTISVTPPGAESIPEMRKRVLDALEIIIDRHRGEEIVIYAHAGVNRIILCHALNLGIENWFRLQQDFCGVSIVDFHETGASVVMMNRPPQAEFRRG